MTNKKYLRELKRLNKEQKEAVETIEGPVMVIAGPGTGKTQILAMRIANILTKTQVNPSNILALTFTNSGVHALKNRLLEIIGPASYQIHVHTFHSFCNEVINTFPEKFLTAKKIDQLDDLEKIQIIQKILDKHDFKFIKPLKSPYHYQKTVLTSIGKLKQENIPPKIFEDLVKKELEDFLANQENTKSQDLARLNNFQKNKELAVVYREYQMKLSELGKYDFDDMILHVVNAFQDDPEILNFYQEKFLYILIDEYQDTNSAQNRVVDLIGSFHDEPNIFVVGDDEQSIYRFQGASLENILYFKKTYLKAKIIILKENYRSGQTILDASRAVISNNQAQIFRYLKIGKDLKSNLKIKGDILVAELSNGEVENYFIVKKIGEILKKEKNPSEIAVVYRENKDAKALAEIFSRANIPYRLEIGENILDDPEIRKIITFFKALDIHSSKDRNLTILEVLHYPFFKISPLDIYRTTLEARKNKTSIFDILFSSKLEKLQIQNKKSLEKFINIFSQSLKIVRNSTFTAAFEQIIEITGYLEYLLKLPNNIPHLNRLQSLFNDIKQINAKQKDFNLEKFLERLELLEENDLMIKEEEISADFEGVNLMTAHKAKGLEFDHIFIIHFTDKHWGGKTMRELIKPPDNLLKIQSTRIENDEEERRLFYVAMTRAKKDILIAYAKKYGQEEAGQLALPSKFLGEIPKKFLRTMDTKLIENEYKKRLRLSLGKKKWQNTKAFKEFLKEIISEFKLNPTAFNSYLECPQQFFFDHILRVPKAKDFSQSYGTAVHTALEYFFKKYRVEGKLPSKNNLLTFYRKALDEEILKEEEIQRAESDGVKNLGEYYEFYKNEWLKKGPPLICELNFNSHNVHFGTVPISGIIDKVELMDSISHKVKIIDYKTSAPKSLNFLLGKTKEKDTTYLYQAYFYKLLTEEDPNFSWDVKEIEFEFLSPKEKKFFKVKIPIEKGPYEEFKKMILGTYKNILAFRFQKSTNKKNCKKYNKICNYFDLCENLIKEKGI